jgi:3-oxoacyl-[acyl-carrier protein] reductase
MSVERQEGTESLRDMTKKVIVGGVTVKETAESLEVVGVKGRLLGKVALITGGASGIGRGIAHRFALEGAKVSIVDVNIGHAKNVVKEINDLGSKAIALQCDVRDENQVDKAIEETEKNLGSIDILVNDAGIFDIGKISDITLEKWRTMFQVHVEGTFLFSRAVLKNMKKGGRIINISSVSGITGDALVTSYSAAKAAIVGFTKSLALEVAHKGITVNAIAPGLIYTPMIQMIDTVAPELYKDIPAKRLGKPEDIAAVAAFLASPEASYITGQVIIVDGGLSLTNVGSIPVYKMMEI